MLLWELQYYNTSILFMSLKEEKRNFEINTEPLLLNIHNSAWLLRHPFPFMQMLCFYIWPADVACFETPSHFNTIASDWFSGSESFGFFITKQYYTLINCVIKGHVVILWHFLITCVTLVLTVKLKSQFMLFPRILKLDTIFPLSSLMVMEQWMNNFSLLQSRIISDDDLILLI